MCIADLLQSGKLMGVGLSDKTAGSIISVLPVLVSGGKSVSSNATYIKREKISDIMYNHKSSKQGFVNCME